MAWTPINTDQMVIAAKPAVLVPAAYVFFDAVRAQVRSSSSGSAPVTRRPMKLNM